MTARWFCYKRTCQGHCLESVTEFCDAQPVDLCGLFGVCGTRTRKREHQQLAMELLLETSVCMFV